MQYDLVAPPDARLDERGAATIPVDPAQSVVIRDDQQCDWAQAEVIEEGEGVRAIVERCRRDIV